MNQLQINYPHCFVLLCLMFGLNSCLSVYFDQPQPKNGIQLKSVPKELQGSWIEKSDTVYIGDNGIYHYEFDSLSQSFVKEGLSLSDSVLLYKAGEYYVVNFTDDYKLWEVEIIHRHDNGDLYFYYPRTAPYFGRNINLRVDSISQVYEPVMINDSTGRDRRVLFKKSLKMKNVMSRNAVYYKGQFRIRDIPKVIIPENLDGIYKHDGTIERKLIESNDEELLYEVQE